MSGNRKNFSRRDFMRMVGAASGGVVLATHLPRLVLAQSDYGGPLSVEQNAVIEMQIREPGTQRAPSFQAVYDQLRQLYPDTDWNLVYDMNNWESLRPRFLANDPPDGAWLSVQGDPWGLLDEGLLMDLTPLMEAPAYGQEDVLFKDTFISGLLEPGQKDGKQYLLPFSINTWGLWYNRALFAEKGWSVPEQLGAWTWDDFMALATEIKGQGMSAVVSGGVGNAGGPWWAFGLNFIYQVGGDAQLNAMDSVTPGAWNNEVMVTALSRANDLYRQEIIDPIWNGIQYDDAVTLNFQNKGAFNPDGQWHVASYAPPEGFELGFAPTPVIPEISGSPSLMQANAEPSLFVPSAAEHPNGAMEFFRLWNSKPLSAVFSELSGDISPLIGGAEGANVADATGHLLSYLNQAERVYNPMHHVWYKPLSAAVSAAFTEMALGNITPQEAADQMEQAAQAVRDDDTITKHQRG